MISLRRVNRPLSFIFLAAAIGCAPNAGAEPPTEPAFQAVVPGDPSIDTSRLSDHKVKYTKLGGKMTVLVEKSSIDGRDLITTTVWFNMDETAPNPDIVQHDAQSMGFVRRTFGNPDVYVIDVKFKDGRFLGSLTPGPESNYSPIEYDKPYPHEGFEPAIIFNAIRTLPLEEGYEASIPVFDLNNGSQMFWSNITVAGREQVTVGGRTYDTLKVVSEGIRNKTLWFADHLPYPVQMKTEGSPGLWKASRE